jgi:hypothetical protein
MNEPEGEEMTKLDALATKILEHTERDESITKTAAIEKNIREDTPNIIVSNENSVE